MNGNGSVETEATTNLEDEYGCFSSGHKNKNWEGWQAPRREPPDEKFLNLEQELRNNTKAIDQLKSNHVYQSKQYGGNYFTQYQIAERRKFVLSSVNFLIIEKDIHLIKLSKSSAPVVRLLIVLKRTSLNC